MVLNGRSMYDPRWQRALAFTDNAAMVSSVLVRRQLAVVPGGVSAEIWDYATNSYIPNPALPTGASNYLNLWAGPAVVDPDKDWRARTYELGGEGVVFHAVHFSLPLAGGLWNPQLEVDHVEHSFLDGDQVLISGNFFDELEPIKKYIFVVRNPIIGSTAPVASLLCDVNLKGGVSRS